MRDLLHEVADDEHLYREPRQNGKIKALTKKKKKRVLFLENILNTLFCYVLLLNSDEIH